MKYNKELPANCWQGVDEIDGFKPSQEGAKFLVMDVDKVISGGCQAQNFSQYCIMVNLDEGGV